MWISKASPALWRAINSRLCNPQTTTKALCVRKVNISRYSCSQLEPFIPLQSNACLLLQSEDYGLMFRDASLLLALISPVIPPSCTVPPLCTYPWNCRWQGSQQLPAPQWCQMTICIFAAFKLYFNKLVDQLARAIVQLKRKAGRITQDDRTAFFFFPPRDDITLTLSLLHPISSYLAEVLFFFHSHLSHELG